MKIRWRSVRAVLAGAALAALTAVTLAPQQAQALPGRLRPSYVRLDVVQRVLNEHAAIPGTAWVEDPRAGRVVVTADSTVTGAKLARLTAVTSALGEAVEVHRISARLTRLIAGGDAVWGPTARCSLGFNVVRAGRPAFLTAGHCGNAVTDWSETKGGRVVARTAAAGFPGHDYAIAEYTDPSVAHPGAVTLRNGGAQAITGFRNAVLGEGVQRSGSTTGVRSGRVTGLNATVNYQEGQVTGLIKTDVCAEPGDSGGPLFAGDKALGITSGGSGNCVLGGETYYQPVGEALTAYGAALG
ncbi:S1 family peptidase [Streptomyces cinnamoneus]|uniref:Serine protease n=1 Tax=Streptomyces cinnamoneus TaxID=53446 RepID=A0A918WFJ8_STRCJ|nr:S1 family peptidase [Streptomyces cinnamoneus]GHC41287.1 serine protease [Streptomyces cinnamoneus]